MGRTIDFHILYLPSLQISAYGHTFEEANAMLKETLSKFLEDIFTFKKDKIQTIIRELGWEKEKLFNKRHIHLSDTTFSDIKEEFNLPEETKVQEFPVNV